MDVEVSNYSLTLYQLSYRRHSLAWLMVPIGQFDAFSKQGKSCPWVLLQNRSRDSHIRISSAALSLYVSSRCFAVSPHRNLNSELEELNGAAPGSYPGTECSGTEKPNRVPMLVIEMASPCTLNVK